MGGCIHAPVIYCPVVKLCWTSSAHPRQKGGWSCSCCPQSSSPHQRSCSHQRGRGERDCCYSCLYMAGFHSGRRERLKSESHGLISGFWEIRYERHCNSGRECWVVYMCKSRCSIEGAVPTLQLRMSACTCMVGCAHGNGQAMVPRSSKWSTELPVELGETTGLMSSGSVPFPFCFDRCIPLGRSGCFLITGAAYLLVSGATFWVPWDSNLLLAH